LKLYQRLLAASTSIPCYTLSFIGSTLETLCMMPRTPTTGSQGSPESDSGRTGRSADTADSSAWIRRLGRNLSPVSLHGRINISAFFEASGLLTVTAATDVPNATSASHPANSKSSESDPQIKPEAEALALSVRRLRPTKILRNCSTTTCQDFHRTAGRLLSVSGCGICREPSASLDGMA
jgi:hypothetical protein